MADRAVRNLALGRRLLFAAAIVAAIAGPFAISVINAPQLRAQSASLERPRFEVASVKPCKSGDLGSNGRGEGEGGSPPPRWSPGRLTIICQPALFFIKQAYLIYEDGQIHQGRSVMAADVAALSTPIEGGPPWVKSERFTISAEVPSGASKEMMMGPMMQTLLEDRFQLKIRAGTREVPVYELTVAKGGPKLGHPDAVICRHVDPKNPSGPLLGPEQAPDCTMQLKSISMAELSQLLHGPLGVDRPVIDKTGISGKFEVRLLYTPDQITLPNASADSDIPTIFTALQEQLGLKLVPAKGADKFLVIDHIEEPSPN
jgi:uncharacterized protein (TIGR03435 family)